MNNCKTISELLEYVEDYAYARGFALDFNLTLGENADFIFSEAHKTKNPKSSIHMSDFLCRATRRYMELRGN